jgi:hypothetical protein
MMHKAAEDYIGEGIDLPPTLEYLRPALDKLAAYPGDKYCEYKMALTRNLEPCDFDSPDAWWRGIADLLIINDDMARIVDYKTGKSAKYADTKQLELLSLATFKHFPQVKRTKCALLFVVSRELVPANYHVDNTQKYWLRWVQETSNLEASFKAGVWNARPNFTCSKWCPVKDCIHNGRN